MLEERRGHPEEALRQLRAEVERFPEWRTLFDLAEMEYRQGALEAARQHLGQLLELVPGNYYGLSKLAEIELLGGDLQRAVTAYQALVERFPEPTELTNLGVAQLLLRDYDGAVETLRRAVDGAPDNPLILFNLADAVELLGQKEEAAALYRRVLADLPADPGSTDAQGWTTRGQVLAHLGDPQGAVAAAQRALQLAPDNPQVAYEAALIYTLTGERNSALVQIEAAITGGVGARWFEFPWFDPLRDTAGFRRIVAQPNGGEE